MAQTWFTSLGVLLLGAAFGFQMLYLMSRQSGDKNKGGEQFQIPAGIMNGLVVVYLMATLSFYQPYSNTRVMVGIIFLLIAGLVTEIYLSVYETQMPTIVASYFVMSINVLIRVYLLIDIHCGSPLTVVPGLLGQISQPIIEAARPVGKELEKMDMSNIYRKILTSLDPLREGKTLEWTDTKLRVREALGMSPPPQQAGRRR